MISLLELLALCQGGSRHQEKKNEEEEEEEGRGRMTVEMEEEELRNETVRGGGTGGREVG